MSILSGIVKGIAGFATGGPAGLIGGAAEILGDVFGDSAAADITSVGSQYMTSESLKAQGKQAKLGYLSLADKYDFEAETSLVNATIAKNNYIQQEQMSFAMQERMGRALGKFKGTARVTYAASGVRSDGTPQDALQDIANEGMLEIALYDFESKHTMRGLATQESQFLREAEFNKKAASTSRSNAEEVYSAYEKASKISKGGAVATGVGSLIKVGSSVVGKIGVSNDLDYAINNTPGVF